jgi:tRNA A-37 threonylcarbamoyl transferase component Bud32
MATAATKRKLNCWEFNECGRELEGHRAEELGVCPAASDASFHGINYGNNGGRICWAVAGTFCDGKVQGSFAEKRRSCMECEFFKLVRSEEGIPHSQTKFLRFVSQEGRSPIFDSMGYRYVRAGERFIVQGALEETAYIIQHGSCLVVVEKDSELHPVDHYGEGDIVGGMGIITGEPRLAHVEAETDMELWVLKKEQFDHISQKDPAVLNFLTELVASRFDSRRPTAYRTVGKYVTTDIIGRGGYSIVYRGVHAGLNMPVAIKMMRHHLAMDSDFLRSFHEEAKTIATLDHENIVRVYDIEERYATVFIVMELVDGESLSDLIKRLKALPLPLAVDVLVQTCSGLEYAHHRGIIHRDINADNIFLLPGDRVKILDFGLACPIGTEDMNFSGTIAYMAPEQIKGDAVDQRTDIYAMGITAYEMLTGVRPFPEDELPMLVDMHLKRDIPDPGEMVPELPDELRAFVVNCCRCGPDQRYKDVSQAMKDLRPLAKRYGVTSKHRSLERRKMTNLFVIYGDHQQMELNRLMEEFGAKVQELGAILKISDLQDV